MQHIANGHAMSKKSDGVIDLQRDELFHYDRNLSDCIAVEDKISDGVTALQSDESTCRDTKNTIRDSVRNREGVWTSALYKIVLFLIFFFSFCLFNDAAFGQSRTQSEAAAEVVFVNTLEDSTQVHSQNHNGMVIGDSLPEVFWQQELNVVNHPTNSKTVRLADYKDRLLILDFLNTACVPCIASVDKWNELQPQYDGHITVLPIHLYGDNSRIAPFAKQKGWNMPISAGNSTDTLINRLFYAHKSFGQVWIKDGKLLAIPHNRDVSVSLIEKALNGRPLDIQMNDMMTYFDRRYFEVEQKED